MMAAVSSKNLLARSQVEAVYREPFILTGYRRPGTSYYQCLQYALILHNEVGNFWTHFIPLLVWLVWLLYLALSWEDFFQPYHYPLVCFWAGACSYALFSSIAHLFSCKSFMVHNISAMLDYLGIALYGLGFNLSGLFYFSATNSVLFSHTTAVIFIEVCLAIFATSVASLSRFWWHDYRFFVRPFTYVPPYLCSLSPFLHRVSVCWLYGTDCVPDTAFWHTLSICLTLLMVFFYVSKIPERFLPGKFDIFFQSHQFFHVCSVSVTSLQMYFIPMEIKVRRASLSGVQGAMPSFQTTLLPFLAACVLGTVAVCVLGYLMRISTIKTTAKQTKEE